MGVWVLISYVRYGGRYPIPFYPAPTLRPLVPPRALVSANYRTSGPVSNNTVGLRWLFPDLDFRKINGEDGTV